MSDDSERWALTAEHNGQITQLCLSAVEQKVQLSLCHNRTKWIDVPLTPDAADALAVVLKGFAATARRRQEESS